MTGLAVVMDFGIVLIGDEGGRVTVSYTCRGASSDKTAVVRGMVGIFIGMTIDTGQGQRGGRACLGNGSSNGAICRVD